LHYHSNFAYVNMPLCCSICTLHVLKLRKQIAVTILKILDITIKFSCLDNWHLRYVHPCMSKTGSTFFSFHPHPIWEGGRVLSGSHVCCLLDAMSFGCSSYSLCNNLTLTFNTTTYRT